MDNVSDDTGDKRILLEYLDKRDIGCPVCGYSLRGLTSSQCPECGSKLQLSIASIEPRLGAWLTLLVASSAIAGIGLFFLTPICFLWSQVGEGVIKDWPVWMFLSGLVAAAAALILRRRFTNLPSGIQWSIAVASICYGVTAIAAYVLIRLVD